MSSVAPSEATYKLFNLGDGCWWIFLLCDALFFPCECICIFLIMRCFLDSSASSSSTIREVSTSPALYCTSHLSTWPTVLAFSLCLGHALSGTFVRLFAARTGHSFTWFSDVDAFSRRSPSGNWLVTVTWLYRVLLKQLWLVRDRCVLPFAGCSTALSSSPATYTTKNPEAFTLEISPFSEENGESEPKNRRWLF